MNILRILLAGSAALLMYSASPVFAADPKADSATEKAASDVDPDALAAVDHMAAGLRAHAVFTVKANITNEDVLGDGQKLQYEGTVDINARKPDRFKISIASDIKNRDFYYDGKAVTVFSPRLSLYASFPAPATIAETIDAAEEKYDVELPLADLFTWGTDRGPTGKITSAFLVRPETIDGHACNHYAFRQKGVDWQIWIATDASALPYKLVITDTSDSSMPQYTAVLHWSFPDKIADDVFAFAPPADAHKIVFASLK